MKRYIPIVALLSIVVSACDKETPNPVIAVDVVPSVSKGPTGVVTIPVGGTVQLTANPRGGGGVVLTDRPVTWSSSNAAVAQVNPTTGTVTTVTGVASGTATITAQSEDARGTVDVAVEAPVSTGCQEGSTFLNLRVGEVFTATGPAANIVCLNGGSGSEYTYIPFFASEVGTARLALEVNAGGIGAATGPPNPSLAPDIATLNQVSAGGSVTLDENFERRLREREIRELTPLIPSARAAALQRSGGALRNLVQAVPVEGDLLTLNANANVACTTPDNRIGRVVAVTQRAIVVVDTANPQNAGISDEEYRSFGVAFDTLAYPVNVENFGAPSDIDNNGKVLIFYTRAVNELTPKDNPSFTAGFFFGRDLFPKQAMGNLQACPSSNEREMFYMLAPDPEGVVNNNRRSADLIRRSTVGTIAHEFQHLINASRRLYVNNASNFEEVWLNEGLSHIAEELAFYRVSRLAPRQNIDRPTALTEPVRTAFIQYQQSNFGRFISYLQKPDTASLIGIDRLPTRGAIWAFMRYAADRKAGPDQPFWFALVNSTTRGIPNLRNVLATDPINWMQDWTVSVYTDDSGLPVESRFMQPSWNFRSIMPAFSNTNNQYPLQTIALTSSSAVNLNLFGGGAAYLRFGIAPSGRAGIRITSGGVTPPPNLRISIVRTK